MYIAVLFIFENKIPKGSTGASGGCHLNFPLLILLVFYHINYTDMCTRPNRMHGCQPVARRDATPDADRARGIFGTTAVVSFAVGSFCQIAEKNDLLL